MRFKQHLNYPHIPFFKFIRQIIADEVAKEICPENIESVKIKAGKIVLSRLEKLLNTEKSFAIETTLSGKNHIKTIERAKKSDIKSF